MRLATTVGAAAVLLLLSVAPAVHADGADHTHRPVLDRVDPAIDGLTIEVRAEPAPTLVVRNDTGATVEVLDIFERPFLRIGPDDVQADVHSPDFYRSESPSPGIVPPPSATGGAEPRFVALVDGAEWAWFEHRIAATPVDATWSIPIRVGDTAATIVGRWEAVTVPGRVEVVLDPLEVDGLYISVLDALQPGLFVENDTDEALVVPGPRGEPFLRIGPERTTRATPGGGDAEVVAPTATYAWIDARIGFQGDPPAGPTSRDWEIPATLGADDLILAGTTTWVPIEPPGGDGGLPVPQVVGAIAIPVILGLVLARRRGEPPKGV